MALEELFIDKCPTIKEGDIVLAKLKQKITVKESAKIISQLKKVYPNNQLLVLCIGMELSSVPERAMNDMGWFKK